MPRKRQKVLIEASLFSSFSLKLFLMFRYIGFVLVVLSLFGLSYELVNHVVPRWKTTTVTLLGQAEAAGFDPVLWQQVVAQAEAELPNIYPFSRVQNVLQEASDLVFLASQFQQEFSVQFSLEDRTINPEDLRQLFALLGQTERSLERILSDLRSLPEWALDERTQVEYSARVAWLEYLAEQVQDAREFETVYDGFLKNQERILLLLQNQNEPRSTGGFAGSLVLFQFSPDIITWQFLDTYALDRLVPGEAQPLAPDWFHGLSKTISLRDANFWPDFPTAAQAYQRFLEAAGQPVPSTVVAINLNTIRLLLESTPAIPLQKWDLRLDEYNFDIALQFLVESKITGRFNVKAPVEIFARELFKPEILSTISWTDWARFDLPQFLADKNLLAYSSNRPLQRLLQKWQLAGEFKIKPEADNHVHFDFVSVGANKSEKFVWTKLQHDSAIRADGQVLNTLNIKRTHALKPGEIDDLLGTNNLSPNVRALLDEDLRWKLGAGQNRTVLRVWVPRSAVLQSAKNPSGTVRWREDKTLNQFYYEVPLYVLPGETLDVQLQYTTQMQRGSVGWRPYFLQLIGTPGRDKTEIITTISPRPNGQFSAATANLGRPVKLTDQDFRAVVEFEIEE